MNYAGLVFLILFSASSEAGLSKRATSCHDSEYAPITVKEATDLSNQIYSRLPPQNCNQQKKHEAPQPFREKVKSSKANYVSDGIKEMLKFAQIPASQAEKVADGVCKVATNCDTCQKPPVVHSIQFDNAEVQNQALKAIRNMIRKNLLNAVLKFTLRVDGNVDGYSTMRLSTREPVPPATLPDYAPWDQLESGLPLCPEDTLCIYTDGIAVKSLLPLEFIHSMTVVMYPIDVLGRRTVKSLPLPAVRRDDKADDFCAPRDGDDLLLIVDSLFRTVVFPRFAGGDTCIDLSVYHPGVGGSTTLGPDAGSIRLHVQLSKDEPTLTDVVGALPAVPDLEAEAGDGPVPDGPTLDHQECYEAYIPGPGRHTDQDWGVPQSAFNAAADQCKDAFKQTGNPNSGATPADFSWKQNGWMISYHADGCANSFPCSDLFGSSGDGQGGDSKNIIGACSGKTGDNTFRGGIIYHWHSNAKRWCGYLKFDMVV